VVFELDAGGAGREADSVISVGQQQVEPLLLIED
jgi:hypothetical protein